MAFGKGLGFIKPPYEIDLKKVERTFYNLNPNFINMIQDISVEAFEIADKVMNYASIVLDCELNANLVFTLADHLNFAIKRHEQGVNLKLPIVTDIEQLFEQEIDVGRYALTLIQDRLQISLPKVEAAYIALNIINSEFNNMRKDGDINDKIIQDITVLIERNFNIKIDIESFSYSRFVSHMYYLLKREKKNHRIKSDNKRLYQSLVDTYPKTYQCLLQIKNYFNTACDWNLADEECLYLMLHINRLYAREDCYQ